MEGWRDWREADARDWIMVPGADDDKYSRGVLGVITGSSTYPGAAVLGVEAACRTGVGMVRYIGPRPVRRLVLQRRPEVVTVPGRVQAWLLGSGMDSADRTPVLQGELDQAIASAEPVVLDAGALDLVGGHAGPTVITPHAGELAKLLGDRDIARVSAEEIRADAPGWTVRAAGELGVTVLLKGWVTQVADPDGARLRVAGAPGWLATAGTGDVLGGVLGALLATHADELRVDAAYVAPLAATAALLHAAAARRASAGGPVVALDVAGAVPATIAGLVAD
jgi:hydroxyethylthiazole kinase-like uncharacterized protein yjeF